MLSIPNLRFLLVVFLFALPARPQLGTPLGRSGPQAPAANWPQNHLPAEGVSLQAQKRPTVDVVRLQRDAQELAELSASVPGDVSRVNRGLLSKDLVDKLKRVEKLSKQLRGELTR
jgi:hypothetical protein